MTEDHEALVYKEYNILTEHDASISLSLTPQAPGIV